MSVPMKINADKRGGSFGPLYSKDATINADKRGGSFGPLYSKDAVYNDSVWIDTSHIVVGLDGYSETRTVTIERGSYTA